MEDKSVATLIGEFCDEFDYEFRGDYGYRGGYGRTCVGIVTDDALDTIARLCDYLRDEGVSSASEELGGICRDSMGMSSIIYFTGVESNAE